jgi:GT2 family glycosyltransferase
MIRWPGAGPRIELDFPVPGAEVEGKVEVTGWAVPRSSPIERVEAGLGSGPPVRLDHGQDRPDVAAAHGCDPACGFGGVLPLEGVPPGPVTLHVVAVDGRGRRAVRRVTVTIGTASSEEAQLEIEHVRWRGDELEVEGFALAPRGAPWRTVAVEVEGAPAAAARRGLSRPDLVARFPRRTDAARSGFQFRGRVAPAGAPVLVAETADGRALRRPLPGAPKRDDGRAIVELAVLVARLRDELSREPTLLDATGFGLAADLAGELVVTPLDPARLPYLERSFDVVALDRADPERLAVARTLASRAVVRVQRAGSLEVLWNAEPTGRKSPSVSVVIPVFNQSACTDACLHAVLDTWPHGLDGELLVVDDGSTDDTQEVVRRWTERDARVRSLVHGENRGFVAACNTGAQAASGEVLVLLNNDTLPRPGWLPPLVSVLARDRAGAVGGKLLYPDGVLQEAGGVVFSDADGWNYGKGDAQADHPIFDHVREVDYCSGALLATPRELFLRLGGFDPAYAPAYYEDTDYAFRLRAHGYRVYYQPASEVVHLEGASSGRDVASGVKRHQVLNRSTFASRWADTLLQQPPHPPALDRTALHRLRARGPDPRHALVVLPTMPEQDRESGSRRAFHVIELLVEAGWATSVVVENAAGGERYARALRQLGAAVYAGPATRGAGADYLERLSDLVGVERFDLALLAFWHVAERHLASLRAWSPGTRVLVDSVDLHFLREARRAFGSAAAGGRVQDALDARFADELRRELNVYAGADGVLTVSAKEAAWIDDLVASPGHALCVPDLEDAPSPCRPLEERRGLLFLGNFRHGPNVDALGMLAEVVARLDPRLLAEQPISVVGNGLERGMLGVLASHPQVRAVGWVPSVEPYLEKARLSLAPLRHGAGTKRKLLQSALAGTPSVVTSVATEGLGLEHGREVLVADDPGAFAGGVERLVSDRELWARFSAQGRAAVLRAHGRDTVRPLLRAAIETVLARPPRL